MVLKDTILQTLHLTVRLQGTTQHTCHIQQLAAHLHSILYGNDYLISKGDQKVIIYFQFSQKKWFVPGVLWIHVHKKNGGKLICFCVETETSFKWPLHINILLTVFPQHIHSMLNKMISIK